MFKTKKLNIDTINLIYKFTHLSKEQRQLIKESRDKMYRARKAVLNRSIELAVCPFCHNEYIYEYWCMYHIQRCYY